MKKIMSSLMTICLILIMSLTSFASTPKINIVEDNTSKIFFDDGSYIVITLIYDISNQNNNLSIASNTYTKQGTKTVYGYNGDDDLAWQYNLTATFFINEGVSATCTNAIYDINIIDDAWKFSDGNAYIENNVAHGVGVFKKKVLFITTKTVNIDISISCDSYGNFA